MQKPHIRPTLRELVEHARVLQRTAIELQEKAKRARMNSHALRHVGLERAVTAEALWQEYAALQEEHSSLQVLDCTLLFPAQTRLSNCLTAPVPDARYALTRA